MHLSVVTVVFLLLALAHLRDSISLKVVNIGSYGANVKQRSKGRNDRMQRSRSRMSKQEQWRFNLNSSTCKNISYQISQKWDESLPPASSVSLSSITTRCSNDKNTVNETIDDVCRIRVGVKPKITMVSLSRCLATAWLVLGSLQLPEGDIVETGTWRGGMSILCLILMKRYDNCLKEKSKVLTRRSFWAFDSYVKMIIIMHVYIFNSVRFHCV